MNAKKQKKSANALHPPQKTPRWSLSTTGWICVALTLFGLLLRLIYLGRASYQIDEIITIRDAISQRSVWAIYTMELERFVWYRVLPLFMMPIYWVHGWLSAPGTFPAEWVARLPGAVVGSAALPLFYFLTRTVAGRNAGIIALLLVVVSPFHLYYTREAYSYGYVMSFSCGMLLFSVRLLQRNWHSDISLPWKLSLGYIAFATLFLHTHMTCAVFFAVWNLVFAGAMIATHGFKPIWKPRMIGFFAFTLAMPLVFFSPFIIKLLSAGYKSTDASPYTIYFNFDSLKALIGRMGWGESLIWLVSFILIVIAGIRFRKTTEGSAAKTTIILFAQIVLYIAIQGMYQRISDSRFETRYFSSSFPVFVLLVASGIERIRSRIAGEANTSALRRIAGFVFVAIPVTWMMINAALIIRLDTRGYNYRGIANWLNERLPENGVYAFYNVYELRGVPNVYQTPGRDATSVAAWSSKEDFDRAQPAERAKSLFTRIPQAAFVEIAPGDLLAPEIGQPPIDREGLFARSEWIEDPVADQLFRWRTHPMGEIQWANKSMHRALISFNTLEDLPEMAMKRGRTIYHEYGRGWRYFNDQGYNHWMSVRDEATLWIGNTSSQTITSTIILRALAPPPGCTLRLRDASGNVLGNYRLDEKGLAEIKIPAQALASGKTEYIASVIPASGGSPGVPALIYSIETE